MSRGYAFCILFNMLTKSVLHKLSFAISFPEINWITALSGQRFPSFVITMSNFSLNLDSKSWCLVSFADLLKYPRVNSPSYLTFSIISRSSTLSPSSITYRCFLWLSRSVRTLLQLCFLRCYNFFLVTRSDNLFRERHKFTIFKLA